MPMPDLHGSESANQICATVALQLAYENRLNGPTYWYWICIASIANERTRESMTARGVRMATFGDRGSLVA